MGIVTAIFLIFFHEKMLLGTHWKRLDETLPMSTKTFFFQSKNQRNISNFGVKKNLVFSFAMD